MYPLRPARVYMLERVSHDERCVKRMRRMLEAMDMTVEDAETVNEQEIPRVLKQVGALWPPRQPPDDIPVTYTKALFFTTLDLKDEKDNLTPLIQRHPEVWEDGLREMCGQFSTLEDQHPHDRDQKENMVCWPTYNLGTVRGCSHGCLYCTSGCERAFLTIALNLEEYMQRVVAPAIEK